MNKKLITLLAISAFATVSLTACGTKKEITEQSKTTQQTDAFTGATAGTESFNELSKGLSEEGSWIAATTKDINASNKELNVKGIFKNKAGQEARKLALYTQNSDKTVMKRFTLTVTKLIVDSPNFYISNGTVKGDVIVNTEGFHGQTGKGVAGEAAIDGNLIFKTKDLMEKYNMLSQEEKVTVTGETRIQ